MNLLHLGRRWTPAILLGTGAFVTVGPDRQERTPLRAPLAAVVPATFDGFAGVDAVLSEAERRVAGVSAYLIRQFDRDSTDLAPGEPRWFAVYVGYYESQVHGQTVHSPRNCLPGAGWEPLRNTTVPVDGLYGVTSVNEYLLQNETSLALVLYWYQGRGRVAANEYAVKWDLLRDAAIRRRTEEALVRVVVPVRGDEGAARALGHRVAQRLQYEVARALPE